MLLLSLCFAINIGYKHSMQMNMIERNLICGLMFLCYTSTCTMNYCKYKAFEFLMQFCRFMIHFYAKRNLQGWLRYVSDNLERHCSFKTIFMHLWHVNLVSLHCYLFIFHTTRNFKAWKEEIFTKTLKFITLPNCIYCTFYQDYMEMTRMKYNK